MRHLENLISYLAVVDLQDKLSREFISHPRYTIYSYTYIYIIFICILVQNQEAQEVDIWKIGGIYKILRLMVQSAWIDMNNMLD